MGQMITERRTPGEFWFRFHPLTARDQQRKLRGSAARAPFDASVARTIAPEGVTFREDQVGGLAGWWCKLADALPSAAILHLHGGWFNWGSAVAYRHLVGHIARSAKVRAFVADYRLAPEHPF